MRRLTRLICGSRVVQFGLAAPALLVLAGGPARPAELDVGPSEAPGVRAIGSIRAADIGPGRVVRLHAGRYRQSIVIPVGGAPEAPLTVLGAGDGPMEIDGSIILDGASFVVLKGLRIDRASDAGIILRNGSHDITIEGSEIAGTKLGIWIGQGAGDGNRIEDNVIRGAATHGIAVDGVNAAPGRETVFARNHITDNGVHGIEVSGNHYRIEGNIVSGNGRRTIGASGIHIYAANGSLGVGRHNVITGNISFDNHDATAQDGNGIQLDQWCDDNVVSGNIVFGNDGAGISVFDAGHARIVGNTSYGNQRDPGRSHRHKGEIVFATDDDHDVDGTREALAEGNIAVATNPAAVPLLVDRPTAAHAPLFGRNLVSAAPGGSIARWAGQDIADIAAWNGLAPHAAPDLVGTPRFADPTRPSRAGFTLLPDQPALWRTLGAETGPKQP